MTIPNWIESVKNGVILKIVVQPRASKTQISGLLGEPPRLKIRIAAPPVEGEANEELCHFLKKKLCITLSQIQIIRGESFKFKDVFCAKVSAEAVLQKLSDEVL